MDNNALANECLFTTARSGGKGGQHVNKVETKVLLRWSPAQTALLPAAQIELLEQRLAHRTDAEGYIHIVVQQSRSQQQNKQIAIEKLAQLIAHNVRVQPPRKKTQKSKAAKERTLRQKAHRGALKVWRRAVSPNRHTDD